MQLHSDSGPALREDSGTGRGGQSGQGGRAGAMGAADGAFWDASDRQPIKLSLPQDSLEDSVLWSSPITSTPYPDPFLPLPISLPPPLLPPSLSHPITRSSPPVSRWRFTEHGGVVWARLSIGPPCPSPLGSAKTNSLQPDMS